MIRDDEDLTRHETAMVLRISIPTVDRLCRKGELERYHLGPSCRGSVRITRVSIERLLESKRRAAREAAAS